MGWYCGCGSNIICGWIIEIGTNYKQFPKPQKILLQLFDMHCSVQTFCSKTKNSLRLSQ